MKNNRNLIIVGLFISAIVMSAILRPNSDDTLTIPIERVL